MLIIHGSVSYTHLLTNKNSELFHKTEEAIHKSREVELNSYNKKVNSSNKTEGANTKDKKRLKKNHMATRPLDRNEYEEIIKLCNSGFTYIDKNTGKEKTFRKNTSLAFAFVLQATLGFRASDIAVSYTHLKYFLLCHLNFDNHFLEENFHINYSFHS